MQLKRLLIIIKRVFFSRNGQRTHDLAIPGLTTNTQKHMFTHLAVETSNDDRHYFFRQVYDLLGKFDV